MKQFYNLLASTLLIGAALSASEVSAQRLNTAIYKPATSEVFSTEQSSSLFRINPKVAEPVLKAIKGESAKLPRRAKQDAGTAVLVDEDFEGLTNGTIDVPDANTQLSTFYTDGNPYVREGLLHAEGWTSFLCVEAGGAVGMIAPSATSALNTPEGDYSGELTITFRAYIPQVGRSSKVHSIWVSLCKGGWGNPQPANPTSYSQFVQFDSTMVAEDGWYLAEIKLRNTYAGEDCFLQLNIPYNCVVIDDLKVVADYSFLPAPTQVEFADFTLDGFTATWPEVARANQYSIDVLAVEPREGTTLYEDYSEDFKSLETDADGKIIGGVPEGWTLNVSGPVVPGVDDSKAVCMAAATDTIITPLTEGEWLEGEFWVRLEEPADGISYLIVDGFNGEEWMTLGFIDYSAIPTYWAAMNLSYIFETDVCKQIRFVAEPTWWNGGKIAIDNVKYRASTPMVETEVIKDLAVSTNSYTFTGLNPYADYYVSVSAQNTEMDLSSEESGYYMAFGISAPEALPASDVDARGGYTANWAPTPKATQYEVDNLLVKVFDADEDNYCVLEEDFDGANGAGDLYNLQYILLDDYTTQSTGWNGYFTAVGQGAVGGSYYYGLYAGVLASPEISLENNGGKYTVTVTAKGNTGDELVISNVAGVVATIALSEDYTTQTVTLTGGQERDMVIFQSANNMDFMIDYVSVNQDMKAGDELASTAEVVYVEGNETSHRFSNLENEDGYKYAYYVYAYYKKYGMSAWSEKSNRVAVDLNNPVAIENVKSEKSSQLYDLQGRRVNTPQQGILYIKH